MLVYARDKTEAINTGKWRKKKEGVDEVLAQYEDLNLRHKDDHETISARMREWYASLEPHDPRRAHSHYRCSDERGLYFPDNFAGPDDGRKSRPRYDILHPITGKSCKKPSTGWRWDESTTLKALAEKPPRIHFGPDETTIPCRKSYLKEIDSEPFASVFYRDGRAATLELERLIGSGLMDFPKNTDVIRELVALISDIDSVILDFFAGSCTTAQAVLELNREDGGDRKFIMVQLPEPTGNKDYPTIAAIGKERIRRVISRLKAEETGLLGHMTPAKPEDLGFKVFKLASPHIKPWTGAADRDPDAYVQHVDLFADPLVKGWQPANLLWEIALREGFSLHSTMTPRPLANGNTVYHVADPDRGQAFFVCLDEQIGADFLRALELKADDLLVCRDVALDDTAAANLALQCRLKTI